jgi:hypothetical protein
MTRNELHRVAKLADIMPGASVVCLPKSSPEKSLNPKMRQTPDKKRFFRVSCVFRGSPPSSSNSPKKSKLRRKIGSHPLQRFQPVQQ